jgi:hypothetical protein
VIHFLHPISNAIAYSYRLTAEHFVILAGKLAGKLAVKLAVILALLGKRQAEIDISGLLRDLAEHRLRDRSPATGKCLVKAFGNFSNRSWIW